jgi:hypothetical protein
VLPFELFVLQHTCLSRWGEYMDPFKLPKYAGHTDLKTTMRLVHPKDESNVFCSRWLSEADDRFALPFIVLMSLRPAIPRRVALLHCSLALTGRFPRVNGVAGTVNHHSAGAGELSVGDLGNPQIGNRKFPAPVTELERHLRRCRSLLRSTEVNQIEEMKRQGLSVTAIAEVTGFDRKTVRKYLAHPDLEPRYKPRPGRPTLLDPLKSYIERATGGGRLERRRIDAGAEGARLYKGGYSTVKEYLQPNAKPRRQRTSTGGTWER